MNAIPGKRLTSVALYEFTSLFVTSYWKFMRAGYRREQRTRRARSIGIIRFEGRGGGGLRFRGRERKREEATLSIAPIKKLPSLSFGPVLYYAKHKVHCSFFSFFLSLSLFSSLSLWPSNDCCQFHRRKFHRSPSEPIRIGEKSECGRGMEGVIKFGGERDGRGRNWRQTERTRRG